LGNIVATAARTDSFLGARYRRIAKRRGKQKAIVATGNLVLVIVYHLLGDPAARFGELGADHDDARINKQRRARNLAAQLQAVTGQRIMIRNDKAVIVQPEAA
jgi:transposase